MALNVNDVKRVFTFEKDGKKITLDDPNYRFSPDDVMSFYANTYPELTTSTVHGPTIKDDEAIYEFKTTIGTKG